MVRLRGILRLHKGINLLKGVTVPLPANKEPISPSQKKKPDTIYHFITPPPHLFVGPAGVWILLPYRQRGVVTYTKNRWRIGNGGFMQAYMSIFGQEAIGRPDLEADGEIAAVHKLLAKKLNEGEIPEIHAALVFMRDEVELQVEGAPLPAMILKQLKDFIRQKGKEKPLGTAQLAAIKSALPE